MDADDVTGPVYVGNGNPIPPIGAAPTSVTAFIGRATGGPVNEPRTVMSVDGFASVFGDANGQTAGEGVADFFANGGRSALVVRLADVPDGADDAYRDAIDALDGLPFNLLCLPPDGTGDVSMAAVSAALTLCIAKRAMLLMDAPAAWSDDQASAVTRASAGIDALVQTLGETAAQNAALYFPRVVMMPSAAGALLRHAAVSPAVAGVFSRMDRSRNVWSAAAGTEAALAGVMALTVALNEREGLHLNSLGINCVRAFPSHGPLIWGARTLRGADRMAADYKYVPVRRLALFIEDSVARGLQWAVDEPNGEPLWSAIRQAVATFLHGLFIKGALQGLVPDQAFVVKCGPETMTPDDVAAGRLILEIGMAPLRPAEFVWIRIGLDHHA